MTSRSSHSCHASENAFYFTDTIYLIGEVAEHRAKIDTTRKPRKVNASSQLLFRHKIKHWFGEPLTKWWDRLGFAPTTQVKTFSKPLASFEGRKVRIIGGRAQKDRNSKIWDHVTRKMWQHVYWGQKS
jgi:hypothetical protein